MRYVLSFLCHSNSLQGKSFLSAGVDALTFNLCLKWVVLLDMKGNVVALVWGVLECGCNRNKLAIVISLIKCCYSGMFNFLHLMGKE